MVNNLTRTGIWNDRVWQSIDDDVRSVVGAIRVAQKIFPAEQMADAMSVPADILNSSGSSIDEGQTKPYIEIAVEFSLTRGQINDVTGRIGKTLAKIVAKDLALAEDMIFFQGSGAVPPGVEIAVGKYSAGSGLLGLVPHEKTIAVPLSNSENGAGSGDNILAAVAEGIALLTNDLQAPPFALILDTNAYAALWGSVINGAPTYTVLDPVLTAGVYGTSAMPANTGLMVALGGDPTTIYFDNDPITDHTQKDPTGNYLFRIFERVQIVARDPRAFVKLSFQKAADSAQSTRKRV
jgi:uncharacterized linocin/CFP29 family protein